MTKEGLQNSSGSFTFPIKLATGEEEDVKVQIFVIPNFSVKLVLESHAFSTNTKGLRKFPDLDPLLLKTKMQKKVAYIADEKAGPAADGTIERIWRQVPAVCKAFFDRDVLERLEKGVAISEIFSDYKQESDIEQERLESDD